MKQENFTILESLFVELSQNHNLESPGLNTQQMMQLQGQLEESLELLNDVVDELRIISPKAVTTIKSLTLQIFECDNESQDSMAKT